MSGSRCPRVDPSSAKISANDNTEEFEVMAAHSGALAVA